MTAGVYVIRNMINGHEYVGQSSMLETRWIHHRSLLKHDRPTENQYLRNAWKLYGADAFVFEVLETTDLPYGPALDAELDRLERKHGELRHPVYNAFPLGCANSRLYGERRRFGDATARKVERAFRELVAQGELPHPVTIARMTGKNRMTVDAVLKASTYWTNEHSKQLRIERSRRSAAKRRELGWPGVAKSVATRRALGFPELQRAMERDAALGYPKLQKAAQARAALGHPGPRVSGERAIARSRAKILEAYERLGDLVLQGNTNTNTNMRPLQLLASEAGLHEDTVRRHATILHAEGLISSAAFQAPGQRRTPHADALSARAAAALHTMRAKSGSATLTELAQVIGTGRDAVRRALERVGMWDNDASLGSRVVATKRAARTRAVRYGHTHQGYATDTAQRVAEVVAEMRCTGRVPMHKEIAAIVGVSAHQVWVILKHADYWTSDDTTAANREACRRARAARWGRKTTPPTQLPLFPAAGDGDDDD